ncbi:hypothetical protein [Vibrio campbellii]|uniref:hypothetical protein n=1 Tax=Vibrio campbellii TaxID=680 RepID=UPI000CD37A86|nr:hypothetical protein [Vibrio campbellii]AUW07353.1 hypothetical protein C1N51_27195 [Vibrio campbellii]
MLRRASNTSGAAPFTSNVRDICVDYSGFAGSGNTVAMNCNNQSTQNFEIIQHPTGLEDQYMLRSSAGQEKLCLTVDNSSSYMDVCDVDNSNQKFGFGEVKDPAKFKLVNRGWYSTRFSLAARVDHNSSGGYRWWAVNTPWMNLDGVSYSNYPVMFDNKSNDFLTAYTSFGQSFISDIKPGEHYEVQAHGTTFNKWMRVVKNRVEPQIVLRGGDDYNYSRTFSSNQSNLLGFNDKAESFDIPEGWVVRFYSEPNYQGQYWTRSRSQQNNR